MLVRVHTLRAQRKSSTNFDCLSDLARQAAFLRNAKVLCCEQPLPFRRVNILIAGHGHSPAPSRVASTFGRVSWQSVLDRCGLELCC